MVNGYNKILEGLSESRIEEGKGIKCDIRTREEALMCIELIMKDYKITVKEVEKLFESAVQEGSDETVGQNIKLTLKQGQANCSLDNISLHRGWGEREIKNMIENCIRTPESIASTLNASDWIEGKDWKKGAGSNDKRIKLKATDTFGNPMFLFIEFK
jgi:hypothetical protein